MPHAPSDASISISTEDVRASSNPATFMTISRLGGQAMVPSAEATPRNGMRSTGMELPSFESVKVSRCCARDAEKSLVASSRSFRSSNCAQLSTAIPKSISRVARPGSSPWTFTRIRSRAVAPARKYSHLDDRAIGSSTRNTRTTDRSTALFSGVEGWLDSLLIDHPGGFCIAAIICCQKVGIGQDRRNNIGCVILVRVGHRKIPELLQYLNVACPLGPHPARRDQLCDGLTCIDSEMRGFEIAR